MAGPGGGPPRKSHTKSRNGCATCKRRHIRCDETFPQCRNCTKHNCRCDYMDVALAREQSNKARKAPDLLMSPEIEMEIENWHVTGVPPFPELMHYPRNAWYKLFRSDLRLIHHIIGLSIDLHRRGFGECTIWAQKMPLFLSLALSNDFVMSSILTLSASHLAWITRNQETKQLAYHHRGIAIKGLHKAIGTFSKENCEAILASSILLSWQASDWQTWASLQQGLTTVLNAMHPIWKHESELAVLLENQRYLGCTNSPVMTGYRFEDADLASLDQTIVALQSVQKRVVHNHEYYTRIGELLDFVRNFRMDLLSQTPEQAFERVQPLRRWLFWLPAAMLRGGDADIGALAILAQFYAVGVALDSLFPDMGGAYLGPLYKSRLQWSPRHSLEQCSPTPPSPYRNYQDFRLASSSSPSATSATYVPFTPPLESPLHSPPAVTIASSPFDAAGAYVTAPMSHPLYPPSPRLLSEPSSLQHSPAFAPPYLENMLCGQMSRADGTLDLSIGLYDDAHSMHIAGMNTSTEAWNGTICT
ncbi:hypothetical protein KXW43_002568 [Aspergillus fumigatus]|nr:hypothetical protein KXW43_002568 [Aspergillus fumigatus]